MDDIERSWTNGDIDGTLRELEIYLSSINDSGSPSTNEPLLLTAYINYVLGKNEESMKYLEQAKFPSFDIQQWIVENNKLIIQCLGKSVFQDRVSNQANVETVQKLETLLEKVQGLPSTNVALLEIHVTLNYGLAMFVTNARESVIAGGYERAQLKIYNTIQRVLGFNSEFQSHSSVLEALRSFSGADDRQIITDNIFNPFSWLCWLLSLFWLLNFKVKEAQELVQYIEKLTHTKQYCYTLEKTGFIFSLLKYNRDTNNLLSSTCHLVSAYCSLLNHDRKQALEEIDKCLKTKMDFLPALLIKGWMLYESGNHKEALLPLQQLMEQSVKDTHYKSIASNILGCACAKLGKPHTAMVKFRTSSVYNKHNIRSLLNVCAVYHEMKKYDLEIELQKKILILLQTKPIQDMNNLVTCGPLSVTFIMGVATKIIDSVIHQDRFKISLDVYGLKNDNIIDHSFLSYRATLYSLAHNCLQLKRYKDAVTYFLDFLAMMEKSPVDVTKIDLPGLLVVYHETAKALYHEERYEDTLTMCDKASQQNLAYDISSGVATQKRLPQTNVAHWSDTKTLVGILSCKADTLIKLRRHVEAYRCYERVFELLKNTSQVINPCEDKNMDVGEQDQKRQKTEGGQKGIRCGSLTEERMKEFEHLQAQTLNKQGLLVKSLGRQKEALHLFSRSIACEPDQLRYYYDHSSLLLEMGRTEEALKNWRKIREMENDNANTSKIERYADDGDEMNTLYREMDERVLRNATKR